MKKIVWLFIIVLFAVSCNNLEDAQPETRKSFVYFYGSDENMVSVSSILDNDAIVTVGYRSKSSTDLTSSSMVVLKTDLKGKTLWRQDYPKLSGKGIAPVADGYAVVGDSVEILVDPVTSAVTTNYYLKFFKMNKDGKIVFRYTTPSSANSFLANSVTVDGTGKVFVLGTILRGSNDRLSIVKQFVPSGANSFTETWSQPFDLETRSYSNGKTLKLTVGQNLIWPSSILAPLSGRAYAAFPVVKPSSTAINSALFGENDDSFNFNANDIQENVFGFGALGTVYTVSGGSANANTNFYFMRLDQRGNILAGTAKYYDNGIEVADKSFSTVEDSGQALVACKDGGYLLAGILNSTPTVGNGGKDVLLIKVDAFGVVIWTKTYGGSGDEVTNTAIEMPEGGFLICGTSIVQNFSSMFIIKTNAAGNLTD